MNPKRYLFCSTLVLAAAVLAGNAFATPAANSVVVVTGVFNDCATSTKTVTDNDFALINIKDELNCVGGNNRHAWSFSTDDANAVDFQNADEFSFCATVSATGSANGEVGLRLSPWWSPNVDGQFMLNTLSGEIACFGGRLPFYSFTGNHGQTYVKGTAVTMGIAYKPNGLSAISPATIEYTLTNVNGTFSSGPLAFDEGNPAENPPHGVWGMLQPARAGGYCQATGSPIGSDVDFIAEWRNICYDAQPTPAAPSTWGKVKADYR
jgi:hypothetical protein